MKKKLFIDFDGVIVNTIKAIVDLYNEDFRHYKNYKPVHWTEINTWDFKELECADKHYINTYFNQQRFFDCLEFMDNSEEVLQELKEKFEIVVVSMGSYPNLVIKEQWLHKHIPFAIFIGCDFERASDKAHVDMGDGVFIDDSLGNLITSNAKLKICFGDKYPWNEHNVDYVRAWNWQEVKEMLQ